MSSNPKILVTGSNGQLGMELRELSKNFPQFEFLFTTKEDLPLSDFNKMTLYFETHRPQFCINCAAYTKVDAAESNKQECYLINAEAVAVLGKLCKQYGTNLVHFSTDYVFNGNATTPYKEDDPTDPVNLYGASKLAGEKNLIAVNPEVIIIRTSWVYSSYGNNFVKTMMRLMKERSEINVVNDQFGSPTFAADLAAATMKIIVNCQLPIANCPPGIYHFSNEGEISWYDFAIEIKKIIGSQTKVNPITTTEYPTPAKRPSYSVFDKRKIKETFGIELKEWRVSLGVCIRKLEY